MPLNLKSMCRLCMSNQNVYLYNIFDDDTDALDPSVIFQESLATRIQAMLGLEVTKTDGLSRYICMSCIYSVNRFFSFRENCLEAVFRTKKIQEAIEDNNGSCDMYDDGELPILVYESCPSGGKNAVDPLALPDEIHDEPDVADCLFTPRNNDLVSLPQKNKSSTNKRSASTSPGRTKSPAKKQMSQPKGGVTTSCNSTEGQEDSPVNNTSAAKMISKTGVPLNDVDPLALSDEIHDEPDVADCLFTPKNNDLISLPQKNKSSANKRSASTSPGRTKSPAKKQMSQPKGGVTTSCNSTEGQEDTGILSSPVNNTSAAKMISKTGVPLKYEEHPCGRPNPSSYIKYPEMPTEGYMVPLQNGSFACQVCGKDFNHKSSLKRHVVTHSNAKPYECNLCKKHFTDSSNLVKHIRYMHNTNKSLVCSYCKKEFKSPSAVALHRERVHKKLKKDQEQPTQYKCDVCLYLAVSETDLTEHKKASCTKTSDDPTEKSMNHLASVLSETSLSDTIDVVNDPLLNAAAATEFSADYPIICQICFSSFQNNESLDAHKTIAHNIHKYQCPHCPETFMLRKKYEKHIKAVHDSKSFSCNVCSKSFSDEFSRNLHEQTHSSSRLARASRLQENPQCEFCRASFPTVYALYIHKETCSDLFADD